MWLRYLLTFAVVLSLTTFLVGLPRVQALESVSKTVEAQRVWDQGITGNGIKVAILEASGGHIDFNNPYLADGEVYHPDEYTHIHTTAVAGMVASTHPDIRGIAPDVGLLSANIHLFDYKWNRDWEVHEATWWAISHGADIINNSWGEDTNLQMGALDRYFDYVVRDERVVVVCAAHNHNPPYWESTGNVTSPGLAYNVITVGAIDDYDTGSWEDDEMAAYSSWRNPISVHGDREKPEVVAVGSTKEGTLFDGGGRGYQTEDCLLNTTLNDGPPWTGKYGPGTSFSTPVVAGAAALLLDYNSFLEPEEVKAILIASAVHNIEGDSRLSEYDGAGAIFLPAAYETAKLWRAFLYMDESNPVEEWEFTAEEGQRVRVAIAWDSNPSDETLPSTDPLEANIDLRVYAPDSTKVAESLSWDNPYEIVDFIAPADGLYTARVEGEFWGGMEYVGIAMARAEKVEFKLVNPSMVSLDLDYFVADDVPEEGTRIAAKFFTLDGSYQETVDVYSLPYTPIRVTLKENISRANNEPIHRLDLVVLDGGGNVIRTIKTLVNRTFYSTASDGAVYMEEIIIEPSGPYVSGTDTNFMIGWTQQHEIISRGFVFFDTSPIPDAATITLATLSLYGEDEWLDTNFDIVVQNGQPTYPHDPLEVGDYDETHYSGDGGSFNTSEFSTSGYNDITLDENGRSWINKTGMTKLCLRSSQDITRWLEHGGNAVWVWAKEKGSGYQPKFTVTYVTDTLPEIISADKADFELKNLYAVTLDFDYYLLEGENLVLKFYSYGGAYQGENVVWSGTTPDHVVLLEDIPHPQGEGVQKVELVLTTDNTEDVISTLSTFVVRTVDLEARFMEIPFEWSMASAAGKLELESEFMWIPFYWSGAPP